MALPSSLVVATTRAVTRPRRLLPVVSSRRLLSEKASPQKKGDNAVQQEEPFQHPQSFVKTRLEPGEWDEQHTDPIDRPPFKSNAKIMSPEDFANRPQVGWGEEFASLQDAMMTLTWLDQKQCDDIYQSYLDMMSQMQRTEGVTSHEYVMRVIAQKYNITSRRVSAIVQLAHEEDQIRKAGGKIHYDIANEVDAQIKDHIRNAYDAYGEEMPDSFVEDPKGVDGSGDPDRKTGKMERVEDLYDYDELMSQTLVREQEEARLAIDNHIYIEDVDDSLIDVKIDSNCQKLLHGKVAEEKRPDDIAPLPESGVTKDRFKYVAHIIDTRAEKKKLKKKKRKKKRARTNDVEGNILVEHAGTLRVATVAEVKETSWKPERNSKEFMYAGVKQAWIDRTLHGKKGTWGRFEDTRKEEDDKEEGKDEKLAAEDSSDSSDEEGSSSDSSDEESAPEGDAGEGENDDDKDDKK